MKITIKLLAFLLIVAAIATSCGSGSEAGEVGQAQDVAEMTGSSYVVDAGTSSIIWKGEKFSGDAHNGTLDIKEGTLSVEDGKITGGNFTIDMNSIAVTDDMPEDKKGWLIGHLKGTSGDDKKDGDFFQVGKYPTASFEITKVEDNAISGNLSLLDSTHNVTFIATTSIENGQLTATTEKFTFNRTLWGIVHMSTLTGLAQEAAMKDDIVISINLTANAESEAATDEAAEEGETDKE